jgi:hypothetical protein
VATWQNLAEDAVDELFKAYVGDQLIAVIREQIGVNTFIDNVKKAVDKRDAVITAIDDA